ncbi:MAG: peptidoglycan DD-metalloendopeptidase family protein [Gammaproteobacteria bacterium]|nr:peptidoglycan DD-metalloendopeptidase family protein [Gammaproteobacteria bacterium]
MKKTFFSHLAMLAVFSLTGPAVAGERDSYTQELQKSQKQIETLDREIRIDQSKREEIKSRLKNHDQQLKRLGSKIGALEKRITYSQKELERLESDLVIQRRNTRQQKARLAEQLRAAYRMGRQTGIQLALTHDDPQTFSRLSVYADYYSRARQKEISTTLYSVQKLAETHLQVARTRKSLLSSKQKLTQSKQAQTVEQRARKRLVAQLESGIIAKKDQISSLEENIEKLQALVVELDLRNKKLRSAFSAEQGQLPWPVEGNLSVKFGQPKSGGKLQWNGLFFSAPEGREIQAVASGEVVYADWLNGFGMLLIINHGNGFMSLYGGNRDHFTDTGEDVAKGQVIATVGDTGGLSESGLYFEIRENAVPVDPGQWITPQMQFAKTSILESQ